MSFGVHHDVWDNRGNSICHMNSAHKCNEAALAILLAILLA